MTDCTVTLEFRRVLLGRNRLGTRNELMHTKHFTDVRSAEKFIRDLMEDRDTMEKVGYYNRLFNRVVMVLEQNGITTRRTYLMGTDPYNADPSVTGQIVKMEQYLDMSWQDMYEPSFDRVL